MILLALFYGLFFSPADVATALLQEPEPGLSAEVHIPLKFKYLGEGRQMLACSSDSDLVLKFFKKSSLVLPWYLKLPIPDSWVRKKRERILRRQNFFLQSYRLAQQFLSQETGVLFVHQSNSDTRFPTVAVNHVSIDLNQVPFILQKKGDDRFLHYLKTVMGTSDFQRLIDQFFAFHKKRIALLIADHDRDVLYNYQVLNGNLLYIDPAGFFRDPSLSEPEARKKEWWRATHRLRKWIKIHAPKELSSFDEKLNSI